MRLKGKEVAILLETGFEDLEFWATSLHLQAQGATVIVIGNRSGQECQGRHGLIAVADTAPVDVSPDELDALVIPGGWAPDKLRRRRSITKLVREVYEQGKIIATICHGGQVAISAGIIKGHHVTGSWGIKDDLINAGAHWSARRALVDRQIVSAQGIGDIPAFLRLLDSALCKETKK